MRILQLQRVIVRYQYSICSILVQSFDLKDFIFIKCQYIQDSGNKTRLPDLALLHPLYQCVKIL